jgi:hypothetical protein
MMNPALKAKLTAKAIVQWNLEHFGCEKMEYIKVFNIESRKPVTIFVFHYDWAVMAQEREHPSVAVQNLEWNNNFDKRREFIREFISNEVKAFKKKMAKKKAEANSLENLCPELAKLKFS